MFNVYWSELNSAPFYINSTAKNGCFYNFKILTIFGENEELINPNKTSVKNDNECVS